MAKLDVANEALGMYEDAAGGGSDEENTIDLMTDLLLLAEERGDDAEAILRMVESNFEVERGEGGSEGGEDEDDFYTGRGGAAGMRRNSVLTRFPHRTYSVTMEGTPR